MLRSMTAFGQSVLNTDQGEFSWELRSVNHRFLDVSVRLPEGLRSIESDIREQISGVIQRGKVNVALHCQSTSASTEKLIVNHGLLNQLNLAIDSVQQIRIDAGRCDPVSLLQWPGVVSVDYPVDDAVVLASKQAFQSALNDLQLTRSREGQKIAVILKARADKLTELVGNLRKHRPSVVQRQREKLMDKLNQLNVDIDHGRIEQELVLAAQRLDIDEELDRLNAHLLEFNDVLQREDAVGRRLDFLMQEFNREANTVASKSSDSTTTSISIELKVLIEQMREQVQNIE